MTVPAGNNLQQSYGNIVDSVKYIEKPSCQGLALASTSLDGLASALSDGNSWIPRPSLGMTAEFIGADVPMLIKQPPGPPVGPSRRSSWRRRRTWNGPWGR